MTTIKYHFKIAKPFGNLFKETVVIVVRNSDGNFLLGAKPSFFPPTITRLLGGGIKKDETPETAAQREIKEEMGIDIDKKLLELKITLLILAEDEQGKKYETKIHLIKVNKAIDQYIPGDDIKSIDVLNLSNMKQLVKAYQDLPETLWYKGIEGEFRWIDYGQIYAIVHQKALETI